MCGIVGYIGEQDAVGIIIDGLKRLEYRGYDSAGLAVLNKDMLEVRRSPGKIRNLEAILREKPLNGRLGVGHTRWATHGRPSEENAHPITDCKGKIVVVHNGILENYIPIKEKLIAEGHIFKSETDTEVVAHLVEKYMENGKNDFEGAVKCALRELKGAYALGIMCAGAPDKLIAAKNGSPPLVIGLGEGEFFIASDMPAILNHTRDVIILEDEEVAVVTKDGVKLSTFHDIPVARDVSHIMWDSIMAEKGGYRHYMLKEIYEQPRAVLDTFRGRISPETGNVYLADINLTSAEINNIKRATIVACGTSWHAALIGKYMLEHLTGMQVEVDIGSEFRYRDPIVDKDTLTIAISQSGETADTMGAVREAKNKGSKIISISNVVGSAIPRESQGVIYTHAGPEIGVASTKAFTSQLIALYLLSIHIGRIKEKISISKSKEMLKELILIPGLMETVLGLDEAIMELARKVFHYKDFLYLGRGINYPVALEGALKLKEVSYIHAEGYPAGEMKHGPIALIDEDMPVVVITPRDHTYDRMIANIQEVKARDGMVIALASEGDKEIKSKIDHIFYIPVVSDYLTPLLMAIPLQLLAYHIAVRRGCDVDQPRNLAKSVTVE